MTQHEHAATGAGTSQCDIILTWLENSRGHWVSMPYLAEAAGCFAVHSRVSDLRKRGHRIEHKNERDGAKIHSFYRMP